MAHAVSASSFRSDRMSPPALVLAVLLHVLVVAAVWWLSQDRFNVTPADEPIEVTFEEAPKPAEPPPPPPPPPLAQQQPAPQPPPPVVEGLRPPAEITSDKPTQELPAEVSKEPPAPPPPPQQEAARRPLAEPPPPPPSETVKPKEPSETAKPAEPSPPQQQAVAAPLPPAPSALAKPVEPPPQQQQALAVPPPPQATPQAPKPEHRPSPLATTPQRRPPSAPAPVDPPSQHRFVNPADTVNRARASDNYLWQVARKLSGYRYQARSAATEGLTVVRVTIARDGRLLDISIARSSGIPEFDQGVVAGVRAGSPYSPLPPDIAGDRATFTLPLMSSRR